MMKRIRGTKNPRTLRRILTLAAVILLAMFFIAPVAALADTTHSCTIEGITFEPWSDNTSLPSSGSYYLTTDVMLSCSTSVNMGNILNLCLNGHTVTGSPSIAESNNGLGYMIDIVVGTLNLYDCDDTTKHYFTRESTGLWVLNDAETSSPYFVTGGVLTGANGMLGCAVILQGSSTFNMYDGNIVGNNNTFNGILDGEPVDEAANLGGGGVIVGSPGGIASEFTMYGGTIAGNLAANMGGGVFTGLGSSSVFNMSGGQIMDNTANKGGGVYYDNGSFSVSGTAKISGNHAPTAQNVYLPKDKKITISETGLSGDALIRITTEDIPTYSTSIAITDTLSSGLDYSKFFVSDGDSKIYTIAEENSALVHTVKSYEVKTGQIQHGTLELTDRVVKYGKLVDVVIDCDDGYGVETIAVEKESDGEEVPVEGNKFTMPADNVIISATLKKIEYIITIDDSSKDNITATPAKAGVNDTITITVSIGENEILRNITVTPEANSGIAAFDTGTTFSMPAANVTLKANIVQKEAQITYYSVTVDSGLVNGTISTNVSSAKEGDTIKVTVTPEEGYTYSDLNYTVTDGDPAPITDNTFTMPNGDVVVSAKFTKTMHDVEKGTVSNGQISVDKTTAGYGDTVKVTATPNPGYKFSHFIVAKKGDPNNNFTTRDGEFSMPNYAVTVTAEFTQELYTITVNADKATVTLTPEGDTATYKQEITVSATANEGYVVKEIRVLKEDGSLHKTLPGSSGTFEMPASAVTIKVECEAEPSPSPEPEPSSDSSAPQGSSIWLTETQTPDVPPTETPTETPTPTQPSTPDTEPTVPVAALIAGGLAVIVVIGVGAGLVLRRK